MAARQALDLPMINDANPMSFAQVFDKPDPNAVAKKMAPILAKLKGMDSGIAQALMAALANLGAPHGSALIQLADAKHQAQMILAEMASSTYPVGATLLYQVASADDDAKMKAVAPIMKKLSGLDPKLAQMIAGLMAAASAGKSFLQTPSNEYTF